MQRISSPARPQQAILELQHLAFSRRSKSVRHITCMADGEKKRRKDRVAFKGMRTGHRAFDNSGSSMMRRMERELNNEMKFMPDKFTDPLLDVGGLADPYALPGGADSASGPDIGQAALRKKEGVTQREWEDSLTFGQLYEKYQRQFWLEGLQEDAIEVHHKQRSRATVPSYGQALALGNLMEQMHLEEENIDADQVPYWIRAHFMMEERWGELEAEHSAAAQAVSLAESWGMTQELQDKIDNHDPSLFEGEVDPPEEPDVIESLLEGVLPGTAGYVAGAAAQRDSYMMDILPEGDGDEDE
ncbi:g5079 [Coccomyxa elongata]